MKSFTFGSGSRQKSSLLFLSLFSELQRLEMLAAWQSSTTLVLKSYFTHISTAASQKLKEGHFFCTQVWRELCMGLFSCNDGPHAAVCWKLVFPESGLYPALLCQVTDKYSLKKPNITNTKQRLSIPTGLVWKMCLPFAYTIKSHHKVNSKRPVLQEASFPKLRL